MLWIVESKGDKLSSFAECSIRTQGLRHQIASRPNARWKKTELSRIKLKLELDSPSLWSENIQPTQPEC